MWQGEERGWGFRSASGNSSLLMKEPFVAVISRGRLCPDLLKGDIDSSKARPKKTCIPPRLAGFHRNFIRRKKNVFKPDLLLKVVKQIEYFKSKQVVFDLWNVRRTGSGVHVFTVKAEHARRPQTLFDLKSTNAWGQWLERRETRSYTSCRVPSDRLCWTIVSQTLVENYWWQLLPFMCVQIHFSACVSTLAATVERRLNWLKLTYSRGGKKSLYHLRDIKKCVCSKMLNECWKQHPFCLNLGHAFLFSRHSLKTEVDIWDLLLISSLDKWKGG